VLETPFPPEEKTWTCPKTGITCPLDPAENLLWRAQLLREAHDDPEFQAELMAACRQSLLFWCYAFAYTLRIQETDSTGKSRPSESDIVPFIPWAVQRLHLTEIEQAVILGHDLLTEKSRDMGATWMHIYVFHHQWLFVPGRLFLEMSRVETDVDGADNPRCLFVKHDIINKWLPEWQLPAIARTRMHLVNKDNGSRIDGESSNKAAGSGDRRHAILMDEAAKMENGDKIKAATADVTPCRLVNSTPWGAGTMYSKWRLSGQVKVYTLPWWESPEKGRGRYTQQDSTGKWKIRSPWYDAEELKRTPQEMAQEIDIDHIGSGDTIFDAAVVNQHKAMFARPPICTRTIDFKSDVTHAAIPAILQRRQKDKVRVAPKGPFRLWTNLVSGRPDQTKQYVVGIDISKGQGASNSIMSVWCKETGEKIGEWASANVPPHDLARVACAVCLWVGGAAHGNLPLMIWENNGDPGYFFGREVVKTFQYPHFYRDKTAGSETEKQTERYGWHSNTAKKAVLLGGLNRAYAHGGFINHSAEALDEALSYIRYPDGTVGPAGLTNESDAARKTHGDRVIADALCVWVEGDLHTPKAKALTAPHRSPGGRMAAWKKERRLLTTGKKFDFKTDSILERLRAL
jgi:hypothetical protein